MAEDGGMRYDATTENAVEATGLVKRFGKTTALNGVDLIALQGRVLGPNGAGKTNAVRILATLLKPDNGQANVCGYDVLRDAHQVRQLIGLTGQYASVDEGLPGTNNLIMIGRLLGLPRQDARARALELLARKPVSGRVRLDHGAKPGVAQLGPQPGHQRLQRVSGISWRVVWPDLPGHRPSRHDTPGVQRQQGQQNAQLTTADNQRAPIGVLHVKRAK
jgi:hypothetical protein